MNYSTFRIMVETKYSGEQKFYLQKSFLHYFWRNVNSISGRSLSQYSRGRREYNNVEDAKNFMQECVNYEHLKNQQRVISRKVYKE